VARAAALGVGGWSVGLLLVAAALPVRFPVPALGRSLSVFDVVVVVLVVPFLWLVRRQGWPRVPMPYLVLAALMIGLGAASMLWTADRGDTVVHVVVSIESLLVFAYAMTFLRWTRERPWQRWLQFFVLLLLVPGVLLWLGVPGFQPPAEIDPRSGDYWSYFVRLSHPFIGRSNNLATLLVLFVVPLARWALRTRRPWDVAVALVTVVALVLTLSRGVLLALAIVLVAFVVSDRAWRRPVLRALLWAVPVLAVAAAVAFINPFTRGLIVARLSLANVDARVVLLADFWNDVGTHWLLGVGGGVGPDVHNTFAQQVLSFGVFGGLAVIVALIASGRWWFRRRSAIRPLLGRIAGLGVVALLVSLLVESSFEGNLLRPLIWLGWGLLAVLVSRVSQRVVSAPNSGSQASAPVGQGRVTAPEADS